MWRRAPMPEHTRQAWSRSLSYPPGTTFVPLPERNPLVLAALAQPVAVPGLSPPHSPAVRAPRPVGVAQAPASLRPVLHVYAAEGVETLADELAGVLAAPLPDVLEPDWVAVPTVGLSRWLRLALSRRLGVAEAAAAPGHHDGVAANIAMPFPGALRDAVLAAGRPAGADDPWKLDRLVWALVDVFHTHADDPVLAPVATLAKGATRYGRARRIADRFDRYLMHRPAMLRSWAAGRDLDGAQRALPAHDLWQPHLFRLVRERIGAPSPAEVLPELLAGVRSGAVELALPPRVALFGLTTVPGGAAFIDLVSAVAARHEVHLFLRTPSPGLVTQVYDAVQRALLLPGPLRSDDPTGAAVAHPLLRSWARPNREAVVLLTGAEARGVPPLVVLSTSERPANADPRPGPGPVGEPRTLLAQVQDDLRASRGPAGSFVPAPDDRSLQLHSCHGPARQAEVLRDAVLHALADDPTLDEDDVVILCPSIEQYAPLVEAAFGAPVHTSEPRPSADPAAPQRSPRDEGAPRLSYRITDWSLRDSSVLLGAVASLLDLVSGRFAASAVLDFLSRPPVRLRFAFTDEELARIARWVKDTDIRWGIDGAHREGWGIPGSFAAGTWQAALDRLLLGVAVADDDDELALGGVLPFAVEGDGIEVVGRLADVLTRLAALASAIEQPRPLDAWCAELEGAADDLFAVPVGDAAQRSELGNLLQRLRDDAHVAGAGSTVPLTVADVRRLLGERLQGAPRRPDFFRGGITVSSLTPLRGIPFRVVGVLGLDDAAFVAGGADGDDLMADAPHIGDRDPRAELRQALLEAVLAAGDRLIITRTGRNLVTNLEVPPAVAVAELRDIVLATVAPEARDQARARIEVVHPRQVFDVRNFTPGALLGAGPDARGRPFSFDPLALAAAQSRRRAGESGPPFLTERLPSTAGPLVELGELHAMARHPVKQFLRERLQVRLPENNEVASDDLPVSLAGLERWHVAERVIQRALTGTVDRGWVQRELARGSLPAGLLGDAEIDIISATVDELVAAAASVGYQPGRSVRRSVDARLADGTRVTGVVRDEGLPEPGPLRVTFSKQSPKHTVASWLDLMALTATDPTRRWQAVSIMRSATDTPTTKGPRKISVEVLRVAGDDEDERRDRALDALGVAVDLLRRDDREPIPLFATLSRAIADDTAKPSQWHNDRPFGGGEGDDPANAVVYGHLSLRELERLPVLAGDPDGAAPTRALRYALHLWGAIDRSTVVLELEDRT